jgi:chemotaxis signal transduction protein/nucleoid-associated protein YgaU
MRELLLVRVDHEQYGIWKDEVLDVRDLPPLHRIPLAPACIAGMSIIDNRTVMLADLPVCLGHAPAAESASGRVLLLSTQERITGFIVAGDIGSLPVGPEALFAMPAYLTSPVIDTCVVHHAAPVPIVNVKTLSHTMLEADQRPFTAALAVSGAETPDALPPSRVRVFSLGEETYAVSARGIEDGSVNPGRIAELAHVPRYVLGLAFSDGRVLPVIDLSQRIAQQKAADGAVMLVAGIGDAVFGLLVDNDQGTAAAGDLTIKDLPPLARSSWLRRAIVREGTLAPLVDLGKLLSARSDAPDEKPPEQLYAPDSRFPSLFGREEVEIVEFSLLGVRHAVPKTEVEDVLDFMPFRPLPNVPQIVIGIAGQGGELLPVLDLATVFGRRSLATPEWRMILVKNGDFRALVITEAVFGERRLSLAVQRPVPITLPHRVVYGCYPEADAVRLVMNVEAIAAHFEKSLVTELLPALSREMREAPSKIIPALLGEAAGARPQPEDETAPVSRETGPFVAAATPAELASAGTGEILAKKEEADKLSEVHKTVSDEREQQPQEIVEQAAGETVLAHRPEPERAPQAQEAEEASVRMTKGTTGAAEAEKAREDAVIAGAASSETSPSPQEFVPPPAGGTAAGRALPASEEEAEGPPEEEGTIEAAAAGHETTEMTSSVQADAEPTLQQTGRGAEETTSSKAVPSAGEEAVQTLSDVPSAAIEEMHKPDRTQDIQPQPALPIPGPRPGAPAHDERGRSGTQAVPVNAWRRRLVYGAIGAALVAVVYFFGSLSGPEGEKRVQEPAPAKTEQVKPETAAPGPVESPKPPLVLEVPANRPVDIEIYVVVEGDTLWSISERFTGNPFNYPRIAGENRIADPDLIFPGQRIRLKKK